MDAAAAKRAEIARRWRRHNRQRFGPYDRGRHRCSEVLRLAEHRRRNGGLNFDPQEVIRDTMADPRVWTARAIGHRVKLTWTERCELGLRTMEPHDLTPAELKRKKSQRRTMLNRERQRRFYHRQKHPEPLPGNGPEPNASVQPLKISENPSAMRVFYVSRPLAHKR